MPTLTPASDPLAGYLTPLLNGGLVNINLTDTLITLDRYDATGQVTQSNVRVAGVDPDGHLVGVDGVVTLANGSVGVFWEEYFTHGGNRKIYFREIKDDGTRGAATVVFNGIGLETGSTLSTFVLGNGDVVATADYDTFAYTDATRDEEYYDSIVVTSRFTPGQTAHVTGIGTVAPHSPVDNGASSVLLKGGGYVVTYQEYTETTTLDGSLGLSAGYHIQAYTTFAQLYDANGNAGARIAVTSGFSGSGAQPSSEVVALDDGGFAVAYTKSGDVAFAGYAGAGTDSPRATYKPSFEGGFVARYDANGGLRNTAALPDQLEASTSYGSVYDRDLVDLASLPDSDGALLVIGHQAVTLPSNFRATPVSQTSLDYVFIDSAGTVSAPSSVTPPLPGGTARYTYFQGVTAEGRILLGAYDGDATDATTIYDPRGEGVHWVGTEADEQYVGTPFDDTLEGAGGYDTLIGGRGDDILAFAPKLTGIGFDLGGRLEAQGGEGTDTLDLSAFHYTTTDATSVTVEKGLDVSVDLSTGSTVEAKSGGVAFATLSGIEKLVLSTGNDAVTGGAGAEGVQGGGGRDTLSGGGGADTLDGGDGNDQLAGGEGSDVLFGRAGDDTMAGGAGDDVLDGGEGHNVADFGAAAAPVAVDLALGRATGEGTDSLADIQEVRGSGLADRIAAGVGAATLVGGDGADTIAGGDGNDRIAGGTPIVADLDFTPGAAITRIVEAAADTAGNQLSGGAGDDTVFGASGEDTIDAGTGTDVVYAGAGNDVITAEGPEAPPAGGDGHGFTYLNGGTGNDTIESRGGRVKIAGGDGDDRVILDRLPTLAGVDPSDAQTDLLLRTLYGEAGIDTLDLHALSSGVSGSGHNETTTLKSGDGGEIVANGFEVLIGTAYDDLLGLSLVAPDDPAGHKVDAGGGNDEIYGDRFGDTLLGGDGLDTVHGGVAADSIDGGEGNDTLDGDAGDDTIAGGAGDDVVDAGADNDSVTGGLGNDVVEGGDGNDDLAGDAGDDVLRGGLGDDQLRGGAGNDTLIGGGGTDDLDGGEGRDRADFAEAAGPLTLDLRAGTYQVGTQGGQIAAVEEVRGTASADRLAGDAGDNRLEGGGGNDTLAGGDGDDTLDGGEGTDAVTYAEASGPVVVNLATASATGQGTDQLLGVEAVVGSAFADRLTGGTLAERLDGGAGDDTIAGGLGDDTLVGAAGTDTLNERDGGVAVRVDLRDGVAAVGLTERDTLSGFEAVVTGAFDDTLMGSGNDDRLEGGGGNNVFDGRQGRDTMVGGAGNDTYTVDSAGDVVTDAGGTDTIIADLHLFDNHALTLAEGIENLRLAPTAEAAGERWSVTGNGLDNLIELPDTLSAVVDGGAGTDTVRIGGAADGFVQATAADGSIMLTARSGGAEIRLTGVERVVFTDDAPRQNGHVVDGYLAGATIWGDADGDGLLDAGEVSARTDASGAFTLVGASGPLAATGGTDLSTGLAFTGTLTAPEGATVVTPLTTLVTALAAAGVADPASAIRTAFGLPDAFDITHTDPVAAAASGAAGGLAALKAGAAVADTLALVAAALGGAGATPAAAGSGALAALAAALARQGGVDLASAAAVTVVAIGAGLPADVADTVGAVAAASNGRIAAAADADAVGAVQKAAQGTIAPAIQAAGADPVRLATLDAAYGATAPVDASAPAVTLSGVSGAADHAGGHVLSGSLGTADAGLTVTVRDGGAVLGTVASDGAGRFSFAFTDAKGGARHGYLFTASATDAAGNGGTSDALAFAFDYTPNRALFGTVVHDASAQAGAIYALYDGLLGRAPDPVGFADYLAAGEVGASLGDLAQHMLDSPEYAARFGGASGPGDEAFVDDLYRVGLGRGPDPQGEADWLKALAGGTSRADVALGIATSAENRGQLDQAFADGVFVPDAGAAQAARLYHALLDRAPEAGGLHDYAAAIHGGTPLDALAQSMLDSSEYAGLHPTAESDAGFVEGLYATALGRVPDAAGEQSWLDALAHGLSRAGVAAGIAESPEARLHLAGDVEGGFKLV